MELSVNEIKKIVNDKIFLLINKKSGNQQGNRFLDAKISEVQVKDNLIIYICDILDEEKLNSTLQMIKSLS